VKISEIQGFNIAPIVGVPVKIFGNEFSSFKYNLPYNLNIIYYLILIFLLTVLFFAISRIKFLSVFKNIRLPQIIFHSGLFFAGMGLGYLAYPQNLVLNVFSISAELVLLAGIILAWTASVIFNDIVDYNVDVITNDWRPLPQKIFSEKEYFSLGVIVLFLSLLGGLVVGIKFFILLLIYQIIAWVYSAEPFRLKRIPVIATALSAAALVVVIFAGYILFSGDQNIAHLSARIIFLLIIALVVALPVKDFKDIEGDHKNKIWTIPVLFGDEKGRLIVAIGNYLPFVLSVFFFNEPRLFWWAILFGTISFLAVIKIKPRQLFWWVLGSVTLYSLVVVKIIFF